MNEKFILKMCDPSFQALFFKHIDLDYIWLKDTQ